MHPRARALVLAALLLLPAPALAQTPRAAPAPPPRPSASAMRATPPPARAATPAASAAVPAPEEVLGFRPGDDRRLASWQQMVEYFRRLDAASERVRSEELGKTTMGAPFVLATISAPENLARLGEFKDIQRRLADPRTLGANADRKAERLIARGRNIVLITCGIHSSEVGSTLSSALIAHRLATSDDPAVQKILRETIVLLVPSLNPDGVDIVKRWYDRTLGTPFEGTSQPELYHKYVGHDNNRDWYAFTQAETILTVGRIHHEWHPQIVHDIHQQGERGSRLFLPPYMKPVEPNVPARLVEGYTELGHYMAGQLRAAGFKGITTDSTYDAWTPARAYSHYHGGVRILSETASARIATPVNVRFEDLRVDPDDRYDPRKVSENFSPLWMGGEWRMRDITNYMTAAAFELLRHAADNRERWLRRFYQIGREAVRPRRSGELFAYVIPPSPNTNDTHLVRTLQYGEVEVERVRAFNSEAGPFPDGTAVVRMAQPYGAFAKAMLERQQYPDVRDEAGNPLAPYDVTAHTLPLLMGVPVTPLYRPRRFRPLPAGASYTTGGAAMPNYAGRIKRLGLYKSHVPSMDEGWTRWVLEQERISYSSLMDDEIRAGNLRAKYDSIVIPDHSARAIFEGHRKGSMPEEYTGGLGERGVESLREFVEAGGTLICLNRASAFAVAQLKLPLRDAVAGLKRTEFYGPGSILGVELDTQHAVARGVLRDSWNVWFEDSPVFEIAGDPAALARVKVVARYPQGSNPLLSGWLLGEEKLRGKAALVEVGLGTGRVILFGFRPQYRAQSRATYPLLFNAILSSSASTP